MHTVSAITLATILSVAGSLAAQAQQKVPSSFVNSQGYRITGFSARATGSGCTGGQNYVSLSEPKDKGYSAKTWTTATKKDGGILCSGGTWFYGGGDKKGQAGGSTPDVLIKNGSYYQ